MTETVRTPEVFHCFDRLPKELRLQVWEHHFSQRKGLHIIRQGASGGISGPRNLAIMTSTEVSNSPRRDSYINHEARTVAVAMEDSASSSRQPCTRTIPEGWYKWNAVGCLNTRRVSETESVPINWSSDLLYWIHDDAGTNLRYDPLYTVAEGFIWSPKLCRVAIYFGANVLSMETYHATHNPQSTMLTRATMLSRLESLSELFLVAGPKDGSRMEESSIVASSNVEDEYGLLPLLGAWKPRENKDAGECGSLRGRLGNLGIVARLYEKAALHIGRRIAVRKRVDIR